MGKKRGGEKEVEGGGREKGGGSIEVKEGKGMSGG